MTGGSTRNRVSVHLMLAMQIFTDLGLLERSFRLVHQTVAMATGYVKCPPFGHSKDLHGWSGGQKAMLQELRSSIMPENLQDPVMVLRMACQGWTQGAV